MPFCRGCGVLTNEGNLCPRCAQNMSVKAPTDAQGYLMLFADPSNLIRTTLGRIDARFAFIVLGAAVVLKFVAEFVWYSKYSPTKLGVALTLALTGWVLVQGAWVGGLYGVAPRFGRPLAWESLLAAYSAILIPGAVTGLIRSILPGSASALVNVIDYIPGLIYWPGLWFIGRQVTDGSESKTFRFLVMAGLIPGVVSMLWSFYRSAAF